MEEKIVYTITVRTNQDGIRAAAIVKNVRYPNGSIESTLTTAFAQEDLDLLMEILDGRKPISAAMGGEICGD
jgi:hypothetical protein